VEYKSVEEIYKFIIGNELYPSYIIGTLRIDFLLKNGYILEVINTNEDVIEFYKVYAQYRGENVIIVNVNYPKFFQAILNLLEETRLKLIFYSYYDYTFAPLISRLKYCISYYKENTKFKEQIKRDKIKNYLNYKLEYIYKNKYLPCYEEIKEYIEDRR